MRNLLALLGLAIVVFAGLGWYLGWYHVAVAPAADGHKKVEFDVNTSKLQTDVSAGLDKGKQLVDSFRKDSPTPPTAPAEGSKDFVGPPKPSNLPPATPPTGGSGPVPFK
jgi:hypothetical protein